MVDFAIYILAAVLVFAFVKEVFMKKGKGWKITDPGKKGGSFAIYFKDKHIANIRGKTKAMVLMSAVEGKDMTSSLEMSAKTAKKVVKPVVKVVVKAKPVVKKKAVTVKAPAKAMAKKVVAKKVAAKKVTKKTSKK